jgi:Cohesin domain
MNILYPRILRLLTLACCYYCFCSNALIAQVALAAPTLEAITGTTVVANIRLRTADTLGSLQFTFAWDSSVLQFVSVQNFGLIGTSEASNFNLTTVNSGKLRFLWDDTRLQGVTSSDSITIFSLTFRAIGAANTRSDLRFDSVPLKIRASTIQGTTLRMGNIRQGYVRLTPRTASEEISTTQPIQIQNFPNPFQTDTRFDFVLPQSETIFFYVHDAEGKTLLSEKKYCDAGNQQIDLQAFSNPSTWKNGTYFFTLKTSNAFLTRKIIKTD